MSKNIALLFYIFSFLYLLLHFSFYLLFLRRSTKFCGELPIFLYHLYSVCVYSSMILILSIIYLPGNLLSITCGLIAAHGIYSVSFLELWSLAQGSYSISILTWFQSQSIATKEELINNFTKVGDAKRSDRLEALERMRLVNNSGRFHTLTARGRMIARLIYFFNRIPNLKDSG